MNTQTTTGKTVPFMLGIVIGALAIYAVGASGLLQSEQDKTNELRAQYYAASVATLVSPHSLRERMSHGDTSFVLIDTRTKEDYEREHVAGAINIDTSLPVDEVVAAFAALGQDQEVIVYCYSAACMNGRKLGNLLASNDIYVQEMTIGWNEWRYGWETWNYDTEWDEHTVTDYVASGSEPGEPSVNPEMLAPCPLEGELGC